MTDSLRAELRRRFRSQAEFADGYSPLYAGLFAIVAGWLAGEELDPVVEWLLDAAAGREPFDVTLLLAAALHREVLAGGAGDLAHYFPTAGSSLDGRDRAFGVTLPLALRETILSRGDSLAEFIRVANVQTNETGRGLVWLLPVACLGWEAAHLVELGASAGLNLVADRRSYRVADAADPSQTLLQLGDSPPQFNVLARGTGEIPPLACCPTILSRTGGDMMPFHLRSADDELTLASYVWGDQMARMARLREGIAALRSVEASPAPVRLAQLTLPDGLPAFLNEDLPQPLAAPVVIFNTAVTYYLPHRGAMLRPALAEWADRQSVPVLWLQWEPWWDGPPPPEKEWLAWTAELWPNDGRSASRRLHLAWVHPHGAAFEWAGDWPEFLRITMQS